MIRGQFACRDLIRHWIEKKKRCGVVMALGSFWVKNRFAQFLYTCPRALHVASGKENSGAPWVWSCCGRRVDLGIGKVKINFGHLFWNVGIKGGPHKSYVGKNVTDNFHRTHDDFLACRTHVKAGSWSMQIRFWCPAAAKQGVSYNFPAALQEMPCVYKRFLQTWFHCGWCMMNSY